MKSFFATITLFLFLAMLSACGTVSERSTSFHELRLQPNVIAVLSEGGLEPRSIGSYSLRVYKVLDSRFPYDNYVTGVIEPRDGMVEAFKGQDINQDGNQEIIVITQAVGSGSYFSAIAYEFDGNSLKVIASVRGRAPNENFMHLLVSNYNERSK